MTGEIQQFREKAWLPAFQSFGLSTEFAFTFQPSSFQLQLTVHSTPSILYKKPSIPPPLDSPTGELSGLNLAWGLEARQFFAPIPVFFGDYFCTLAQAVTGATLAKNIPKPRRKSRNRCVLMIPILFYHFPKIKRPRKTFFKVSKGLSV